MRNNSYLAAMAAAALLLGTVPSRAGCGQATSTITNLPAIPNIGYQVYGLNATGQLTGFFYVAFEHGPHAFLYDKGALSDLATFGGDTSYGYAINKTGQVAGQSDLTGDAETDAFVYSGGNSMDLGTLGGTYSSAAAINDAGQVAGSSLPANSVSSLAFVATNGTMFSLGTLGGDYSAAHAINNATMVAGESSTAGGDVHGFVWSGGTMTDVGTLGGGNHSTVYALNDAGVAAGMATRADGSMRGFVYAGGTLTDVGDLGGGFSIAFGVNQSGQVIGDAMTADGQMHGFVYAGGVMTDLGTLGGNYSYADANNNLGQVVGESATTNGVAHGFLWQQGQLVDLNTLLPADSGWEVNSGLYINDACRIVGVGTKDGLQQWFIMDLSSGNKAPVAVAGPDQVAECSTSVTLDGSGSSDLDKDPLTFEWSLLGTVLGTDPVLTVALPLGTNVVTLAVTDPCGASSQTNVSVVVRDTTPPTVLCPPARTIDADGNCQALVPSLIFEVQALDSCTPSDALVVKQSPAAGTVVGSGATPIVVTVTDQSGNSASCTTTLNVVDATPPVIQSVMATPNVLSPPNHALIPVTVTVAAVDNCDPAPVSKIISITASGPTAPGDITVTGALTAVLAASKDSGGARVYTITVQTTDATGNSSLGTTHVTVPASNGNGNGVGNNVKRG